MHSDRTVMCIQGPQHQFRTKIVDEIKKRTTKDLARVLFTGCERDAEPTSATAVSAKINGSHIRWLQSAVWKQALTHSHFITSC